MKDWDQCHYTGEYRDSVHRIHNLKYYLPKYIPTAFHNESNYDNLSEILSEKFEKQFTYLGESTEKCINFTIPIEKEVTRFDKNEEKITKNIFYR